MTETPEPTPGNGGDLVEQARDEVKGKIKEAEKAPTEEERQRRKEEIANDVGKEVKEAVREVERAKRARAPIEVATKQKLVTSLAKALELANQGILDVPDQAKELMIKLARASPSSTTLSAIGEHLSPYLLGEKKIVVDGKITDDFKQAFDQLMEANSLAAKLIATQISSAPEKFGINAEELLKLLGKEGDEMEKRRPILSLEDIKKLEEITHRIFTLITQKIQAREITLEEVEKINKTLISPILSPDAKKALIKLGLSESDVEKYAKLKESHFQFPDFSRYLEFHNPAAFSLIKAAEKEFADLSNFITTNREKGIFELSREARLKFSDLIKKYYYFVFKPVMADRSKSFHENFSHHIEVQGALSVLRQIVSLSCEKIVEILPKDTDDPELREIINFFKDKGEGYQSRIFTYISLFHDLPLYTRNLGSIEKIKEFFSFLFPSQLAEFFDDETGFMQMARDVLTMMIREYLVENKNQYRGDFLSGKYEEEGVRWHQWFRDKYETRMRELARKFGLLTKDDWWKLEMAIYFSEGVGIASLIDGEVLSTSDPVEHFKEVHPLMSFLSPKHNWRGGRGRDVPGRIAKFLLHTDIKLFPEVRPWTRRLWSKKKWVPEEFADWVDKAIKTYGEKFVETFFDVGGSYQELLGLFNIPNSINSWNGWRYEGMMPGKLKNILEVFELSKYGDFWKNPSEKDFYSQWQAAVDYIARVYGASGLWNIIGGPVGGAGVYRLNSELKKFLLEYYGGDKDKVEFHFADFFSPQRGILGNRGRERIFTLQGREGKLNFFEVRQIRLNQLRGEAFFRYLRRNPADFLMIITQLCPELTDDKTYVFKSEAEIRSLKDLSKLEKERILGRQKELRVRWGKNFEVLVNLYQWLMDKRGEKSIVDFIKDFNAGMIEAYERHKTRDEKVRREITRLATDTKISKEEKKRKMEELFSRLSFYLKEDDFSEEGEKFWRMFSGEGGLFQILTGYQFTRADEYFAKFGSYKDAGDENNFFATIAHSWFIKNGDLNPFHADLPYYDVFEQLGTPGESTFARTIEANIAAYKEVVSQIVNLEDILREVAETGKMDKLFELHKKINTTLAGLVGPEYAFRANFVLSQVVAQFFMERSILRDPKWKWLGPIGWLARGLFHKRISLSKLLTNNPYALSMDNNALRVYFLKLHEMGLLPEKGIWSKEHLEDVFEVTMGEYSAGDATPTILWFIILYLLFNYIKKAIEEAEGKKK